MLEGQLKINGKDAYETWGISMDDTQFFARYASFCELLAKGILNIETSFQPGVVYHCLYQSCSQFSQFMRGIGKFVLRITEMDPNNRS